MGIKFFYFIFGPLDSVNGPSSQKSNIEKILFGQLIIAKVDHFLNYKNNKNQFKQNDSKDAYKKDLIKIWQVG